MHSHRGENISKQPMRALERRRELLLTQISHTDTHRSLIARRGASLQCPAGGRFSLKVWIAFAVGLCMNAFMDNRSIPYEWSINQHR